MKNILEKFIKKKLSNESNIFKKLLNIVTLHISNIQIPEEVLRCIIKTQTYIRLNSLNRKIIDSQFKARDKKRRQNLQHKYL